jgi:membrane protease YdiL (CAAX protease family)
MYEKVKNNNNKSFKSLELGPKDILVINGYLLICLVIFLTVHVLMRQIFGSNLLLEYRDVLLYALWGIVLYIGYKEQVKNIILFGLKPDNLSKNIYFAVSFICFLYFLRFCIVLLAGRDIVLADKQAAIYLQPFWISLIHGIVSVLVGPIVEETIFRGFFYSTLRKKSGAILTIILSSIIFTLWHIGSGLKVGINIFLTGIILAYIYEKTESLIPPIIAHAIVNGSLVIASIYKSLSMRGAALLSPRQFNISLAVMYFTMSASFYFFFQKSKQKKANKIINQVCTIDK